MNGSLLADQSGVSAVIAAILMLGLLVAVVSIVQLTYVPEWKKGAELDQMDSVFKMMGQVKTSMETLTDISLLQADYGASASFTFRLGGGGLPFFDPRVTTGTLYLDMVKGGVNVSFNSTYLAPILNESLNQQDITRSLSVRGIDGFNFTLYSVGPDSTKNVTLTITSQDDLPHHMRLWQDGLDLVYQVDKLSANFGASDLRVSRYFQGNQTPIDVLNFFPGLRYRTGTTVVNTSVTSQGTVSSTWNISAVRLNASTTQQRVTGGVGEVGYVAHNYYYVDQKLILSAGSLLLVQDNQSVIYLPPPISIEALSPTVVRVRVEMFDLYGSSDAVSGSGDAVLHMSVRPETRAMVWVPSGYANANNVSLTINTNYTQAWEVYLNDQAGLAGLNAPLGQYSITTTPYSVTLTIEGKLSDATQDIELEVVEAYIYTALGGFS